MSVLDVGRKEKKLANRVHDLELAYSEYEKTGIIDPILLKIAKSSQGPKRLLASSNKSINMIHVLDKINQKKKSTY